MWSHSLGGCRQTHRCLKRSSAICSGERVCARIHASPSWHIKYLPWFYSENQCPVQVCSAVWAFQGEKVRLKIDRDHERKSCTETETQRERERDSSLVLLPWLIFFFHCLSASVICVKVFWVSVKVRFTNRKFSKRWEKRRRAKVESADNPTQTQSTDSNCDRTSEIHKYIVECKHQKNAFRPQQLLAL